MMKILHKSCKSCILLGIFCTCCQSKRIHLCMMYNGQLYLRMFHIIGRILYRMIRRLTNSRLSKTCIYFLQCCKLHMVTCIGCIYRYLRNNRQYNHYKSNRFPSVRISYNLKDSVCNQFGRLLMNQRSHQGIQSNCFRCISCIQHCTSCSHCQYYLVDLD